MVSLITGELNQLVDAKGEVSFLFASLVGFVPQREGEKPVFGRHSETLFPFTQQGVHGTPAFLKLNTALQLL